MSYTTYKSYITRFKKPAIIIGAILLAFVIFAQSGLGARIPLPSWLPEALRDFFERNPDFSMEPYKDGTIILVKPIKTGTGDGAYEAGDIVEIRDGSKPLGREERTMLLPLYYPGKIDEKLKEELTAPLFDKEGLGEISSSDPSSPQTRPIRSELSNGARGGIKGGVMNSETSPPPAPSSTEEGRQTIARRQYGVDYTKFLSGRDILKVRRFEPFTKLPEIDLKVIIKKENGLSLLDSSSPQTRPVRSELSNGARGGLRRGNSESEITTPRATPKASARRAGPSLSKEGRNADNSVVRLPKYLSFIEKSYNTIKYLARSIISPAIAQVAETVKIVDPGNGTGTDYTSLNAWEAAMQADITSGGTNTISVAKLRATNGTADTTAVTVSGWTTDASHYIKIWTDPTESYRHSGKYDTSKYRLEVSNAAFAIKDVGISNLRVDGLQFKITAMDQANYLFWMGGSPGVTMDDVKVSNSIFAGLAGNSNQQSGIVAYNGVGTNSKLYAWNNILYDFKGDGPERYSGAFVVNADDSTTLTWYAYNNTVYDSDHAYWDYDGISYLYNNIAQSSTFGAYEEYVGGSMYGDYNISDKSDAPGGNSKNSAFVYFADSANDNFHLAEADTAAKGAGVDLSATTTLAFSTDIDNQTRSGSWDIGADEFVATPIYRSVGPSNTTAIASSTGATMTISGQTATFSSNMPNNMGVGDVIVYQSLNGTVKNSLAFIHGRTSPTEYTVADVAGKIASSTSASTNWQIFRSYISLSNAEAGTENTGLPDALENFDSWSGGKNLASSTEQWNIAAYADAADTTAVTVDGWTTATSTYIKIYTPVGASEVGTSQRHQGKWDNNKYRLSVSSTPIDAITEFVRIDGLQIEKTGVTTGNGINHTTDTNVGNIFISNNIVRLKTGASSNYIRGIYIFPSNTRTGKISKIWNNIVYGYNKNSANSGIDVDRHTTYVYNNTSYDNYVGYTEWISVNTIYNNIAQGNIDGFSGTWDTASNNISDIASDITVGTNNVNGVLVSFVDTSSSTVPDLHLSPSDVWARDNGADLTSDVNLPVTSDVDSSPRPMGSGFDIGADETRGTEVSKTQTNFMKDSGLVGYWSFNGADMNWSSSTAEVLDRSGNFNNGNATNMATSSVIEGKFGQALSFDGVDDYVSSAGSGLDITGNQITVSAWVNPVNPPTAAGSHYTIIRKANVTDKFILRLTGSGGSDSNIFWSVQADAVMSMQTGNVSGNTWTHIVGVYDGSQIRVYKNGVSIGSPAAGSGNIVSDTDPLYIGSQGGTQRYFKGIIDEVRIYNRALTASEIQDLYRAGAAKLQVATPPASGAPGLASGLVGYWSFNGPDVNWSSSTAEILDRSGSSPANNGNATNMATSSVIEGKLGQALSFDGVDDYVDAGNPASLQITGSFTIASWVKANAFGTGAYDNKIVGKFANLNYSYVLTTTQDNGQTEFLIYASPDGNSHTGRYSATRPQTGVWYHVVGVINTVAQTANIYVNGILDNGTLLANPTAVYNGSANVNIGRQEFNNTHYWDGLIDEVRVYNRALSAQEIQDLYKAGTREARIKKY